MAPARKKVRLDELNWKAVDVPRLDDYEGFFGLEEIDDVDIVKDNVLGAVSFLDRQKPNDRAAGEADQDSPEGGYGETSDFEGFSDDATESGHPKSILRVRAQDQPKSNKVNKKPRRQDGTEDRVGDAIAVNGHPPVKKDTSKHSRPERASKTAPRQVSKQISMADFHGIKDEEEAEVNVSAWAPFRLSPDTLAGLAKLKFHKPTPIQSASIPVILAGEDVIGKASTGSGKTLAFGIPMFETWLGRDTLKPNSPLGLIVSPTRELAHQISEHLLNLSKGLPNKTPVIAIITGGLSVQKQQRILDKADIIVGTPGRLWEVIGSSHDLLARAKQMQYLVLDEADRLLSQGHFKELEELLQALDRVEVDEEIIEQEPDVAEAKRRSHRQTLVFSATFEKDLQHKLARKQKGHYKVLDKKESMEYLLQRLRFRTRPKFIDVDPVRQMAANLREGIVEAGGQEKDLYLYAVQLLHSASRTLVFVNSISSVRRLVPFLQNLNLPALPLHSQMPQKARLRSIERFSSSSSSAASILVATDVAARGLDIPNIDLVLHYHLPRTSDAYIHRSGRTARAGASGASILLCAPEEVGGVRRLMARVHASSAAKGAKGTTVTADGGVDHRGTEEAARKGYSIRALDIDRRVVQRLRPRVELAKRIADVGAAKEKKNSGRGANGGGDGGSAAAAAAVGSDAFFRAAAEELGVEYDSEELERSAIGKQGRGSGRKAKERADRAVGVAEVRAMRAELKALLAQRVNVGVSERYPASGCIDIEALLQEEGQGKSGEFLGSVRGLVMDD